MKTCSKCKEALPFGNFNRDSSRADGRQRTCRACYKVYCRENEGRIRGRRARYYEENRAIWKKNGRARYLLKRDSILAANRAYNRTDKGKEVQATAHAKYDRSPKGKASRARRKHRRRQKMQENLRDFTAEQWQELLVEFNHSCAYCGDTEAKLTQDHVIPVSKMGPHTKSNIVPACGSCNSSKGNKDPMLWATSYGETQ